MVLACPCRGVDLAGDVFVPFLRVGFAIEVIVNREEVLSFQYAGHDSILP